jgi:hypothetical protein
MFTRALASLFLLAAVGQTALAGEKPSLTHRASCAVVRYYVAKFSEEAAEAYARSRGATDSDIEAARACLPASIVRAASVQR